MPGNWLASQLIAWTIQAALCSACLDRLVVSTDDEQIAGIARQYGAEVPFMRPAELAQDHSSSVDAALHTVNWLSNAEGYHAENLMLLQPTSPLRTAEDIRQASCLFGENHGTSVVSVSRAHPHPYWTMSLSTDGYLAGIFPADKIPALPAGPAPGVCVKWRRLHNQVSDASYGGLTFLPQNTLPYIMPPEYSLDIDTPWEFHLAELILKDRLQHEND